MAKGISFQLFIFILIYINSATHRIFITFLNILLGQEWNFTFKYLEWNFDRFNNFQQLLSSNCNFLFFSKHLLIAYFFLRLSIFFLQTNFWKHPALIYDKNNKRDKILRNTFFFFFLRHRSFKGKSVIRHADRFFIRIIWSVLRVYLGCIDEYFASRGIRDSIFKRNMILAARPRYACTWSEWNASRTLKRNSIRMEAGRRELA